MRTRTVPECLAEITELRAALVVSRSRRLPRRSAWRPSPEDRGLALRVWQSLVDHRTEDVEARPRPPARRVGEAIRAGLDRAGEDWLAGALGPLRVGLRMTWAGEYAPVPEASGVGRFERLLRDVAHLMDHDEGRILVWPLDGLLHEVTTPRRDRPWHRWSFR
ncbi:hypothetical protein ACN20G_28790 (plasmid) [Streptomyces sp. BI20]|uniref:hypothetical protein n=1 Tax=Streptomyces sp. BI20 TaxID=3403460 RepID=UPI003C75361E